MNRTVQLALAAFLGSALSAAAQHYQTDFPPEELRARWNRVFDRIGADAVAVVQGMPLTNGFIFPRQYNSFYYLCGIETPNAYLRLDGRARKATLYLPPRNERLERAEGRVLSAEDVDRVKTLTGVDDVQSTAAMLGDWPLGGERFQTVYAELSPQEGSEQSRGELVAAEASRALDPWDGGFSRERRFVELLRVRLPRVGVRDLTPVLDDLRGVKSPREIALIRRASEIAAHGLMEAMRSTEVGVYEYQLDAAARYVFLVSGARLEGYRSITAAGVDNINNMHYYRNTSRLEDGQLVLMDFAPDYGYYTSDVARLWPVNGHFDAQQRELLSFVLEYRNAILARIRPGVSAQQVMDEAKEAMAPILAGTKFSKPIYEQAARRLVDTGGGVFSHTVGLAVHDVGGYRNGPLKPSQVFSVDPQLRVPEENLYIRYEDVVVVTETGVQNFTDFLPTKLEDIEALVREKGIVQKLPPPPARGPT